MRIRPYTPEDREALLEVWHAASRIGHPFLGEADLARQRELVADVYLPKVETWIAEADEHVVGFIGLLGSFVGGLFVAPDRHGQGIGKQLIAHAAALKGPLSVEVYAANPLARAFYARCGFAPTGRRELDDEGRAQPLLVLAQPGAAPRASEGAPS